MGIFHLGRDLSGADHRRGMGPVASGNHAPMGSRGLTARRQPVRRCLLDRDGHALPANSHSDDSGDVGGRATMAMLRAGRGWREWASIDLYAGWLTAASGVAVSVMTTCGAGILVLALFDSVVISRYR